MIGVRGQELRDFVDALRVCLGLEPLYLRTNYLRPSPIDSQEDALEVAIRNWGAPLKGSEQR